MDEFAAEVYPEVMARRARFWVTVSIRAIRVISVNDEVVHGVAGDRELHFGDILSVDVGVIYKGFMGDTARTVAVGGCGVAAQRLMDVTERALYEGIAAAVPGNRVTDISRAVQKLRRRQRIQRGA